MKMKIDLPLIRMKEEYKLAYHIGAQSTRKYVISIEDQNGVALAIETHENGGYEPCVGMDIISVPGNTLLSIVVEYAEGALTSHAHHNFTKDGKSELYALYLADEDLNFHTLAMHFVTCPK